MSEIERLIEKGIFKKDFFKPETICDFYVDEKRKKIWAISLDLLIKFDGICRKYGLKYSLAFGSLLGVVRHNGFIPWDDDIDVVMPREDYEKLRRLKSEFEHPYFLQFPGDDNEYCYSFAKLRNSNTSSVSWAFRYENFNQGQFLDIFPLDNYNKSIEEDYFKISELVAECSALMRRKCPKPDENDIKKLSRFPKVREVTVIVGELEELLQKYNMQYSDQYIVSCCLVYSYNREIFDKELFDNLKEVDLYGHKVYIPQDYDRVLRITYGDYMQLPPVEKRGQWHSKVVFEPDVPYKEMLKRLREEAS